MTTIDDKSDKALVPRPPSAVEKAGPSGKRILSGMVADTLALVDREQRTPAQSRFRIGDYEWCEPDYRQILIWAEETGLKPEEVIARLLDRQSLHYMQERWYKWHWYKWHKVDGPFFKEPLFAEGRLLKVNLDLRLLRCSRLEWVNGLEISHLNVNGDEIASLQLGGKVDAASLSDIGPLSLPRLVALSWRGLGLTHLNLTGVPQLEYLNCMENRLEELQLDRVPNLTNLECGLNELTQLKFDHTTNLYYLDCCHNKLTQLDLSGLDRIKMVFCERNRLRELKLAKLPNLRYIECMENCLRELDLGEVPELAALHCDRNQISNLDLNHCPNLEILNCDRNRLTHLDLSLVRKLERLDCADNDISELNLNACPNLTAVDCSGNPISVLDIRGLKHLRILNRSPHTKVILDPEQEFPVHIKISPGSEPDDLLQDAAAVQAYFGDLYLRWRDYTEVVKWYRKAAEQGYAGGQATLGWCYRYGVGVPKDCAEAVMWFKLAAEQGNKYAVEELASLTSALSLHELQEGERRYREFKPSRLGFSQWEEHLQ